MAAVIHHRATDNNKKATCGVTASHRDVSKIWRKVTCSECLKAYGLPTLKGPY